MTEEEKKEIKISHLLFTSNEEAQLENTLNFHLEEFVNEINKTMSKDTDIIILKKVIEKQQKEIERLNRELICCDNMYKKMKKDMKKEIEEFRGIKNGTTIIYKCKAKYVREDKINKYYVEKNKIREKIKEVSNGTFDAKIILEHLLDE